jgi:hypothetical protein
MNPNERTTGRMPEMLQDCDRKLSRALSNTPDARLHAREAAAGATGTDTRTCTCHPDDNPPRPCPRKFALSECRAADGVKASVAHQLLGRGDIIQRGDEVLADDTVTWLPLHGWEIGSEWGSNFMPMRRRADGVAPCDGGKQ